MNAALDGQGRLGLCSCAGARNAPAFAVTVPAIVPFPPSVPALTSTAPVPVPELLWLFTTSVPAFTVVPCV